MSILGWAAAGWAATPTPVPQHRALFINVDSIYNQDGLNMYNTLVSAGADATWVHLSSNGQAAAQFLSHTFDQVWVFDLSHWLDAYPSDWQAVANWFNQVPNRAIICDARIISSYWRGRHTGEGQLLTQNYYENLKLHGGGLVLGTDHDEFHGGINTLANLLGLEPFTGSFALPFIPVDTQNPLMFYPNSMGGQLYDDSTPGQTPYGLQPNGRILYTVAWHSGNPDTPGISSTIEGEIGFHAEIISPYDGQAFYNENIPLTARCTGGTLPCDYVWSSDIDGELGTGETLAVHTSSLSFGPHTITVLASDASSRYDDDLVHITVLSASPTPAPIPATGSAGLLCLALTLGGILARSIRRRA